jgi:hypothetical protein
MSKPKPKATKDKKRQREHATIRKFSDIPQSDFTLTSAAASGSQVYTRVVPLESDQRPEKRIKSAVSNPMMTHSGIGPSAPTHLNIDSQTEHAMMPPSPVPVPIVENLDENQQVPKKQVRFRLFLFYAN